MIIVIIIITYTYTIYIYIKKNNTFIQQTLSKCCSFELFIPNNPDKNVSWFPQKY